MTSWQDSVQQSTFLWQTPTTTESKELSYIMGIDEAGRGPILGPMVYSGCYYVESEESQYKGLGFDDSKVLTQQVRENLFKNVVDSETYKNLGFVVYSLAPSYISSSMLNVNKYNLNSMAHDTTIQLIEKVLKSGIRLTKVYVDTVGPPEKYEAKLSNVFPQIRFTVRKKADSLFLSVSMASVVAKVTRDYILHNWKFDTITSLDEKSSARNFGSGYTSDKYTVEWLKANIDPVFGWNNLVRYSWATADNWFDKAGKKVNWFEDDTDLKENYVDMAEILNKNKRDADGKFKKSESRSSYFKNRGLKRFDILK